MIPVKLQGISSLSDGEEWQKQKALEEMLVQEKDDKSLCNYIECKVIHPKAYRTENQKAQHQPLESTRE